jgi:hypothetical protein
MGHKARLSADVVTNVAFGLTGVVLTTFMIWQAARYTASRNHYPRKRFYPPHPDHNSLANPGLAQDVEVAPGPAELEELPSLDLQPLPEPVQQGGSAVTDGAEIATPPTAILPPASQHL